MRACTMSKENKLFHYEQAPYRIFSHISVRLVLSLIFYMKSIWLNFERQKMSFWQFQRLWIFDFVNYGNCILNQNLRVPKSVKVSVSNVRNSATLISCKIQVTRVHFSIATQNNFDRYPQKYKQKCEYLLKNVSSQCIMREGLIHDFCTIWDWTNNEEGVF